MCSQGNLTPEMPNDCHGFEPQMPDLTQLTDDELIDLNHAFSERAREVRKEYWGRRDFDPKDIK